MVFLVSGSVLEEKMLKLNPPSQQQLDFIHGEFDTNPEAVRRDAQDIMAWLEKQPHLPNVKDEEFIVNGLLRCKNSIEKTKNVLEAHYIFRATMPELFQGRDPTQPAIELTFKAIGFIPLPKLTPDGCRVSILRVFDPNLYDKINPDDVHKCTFLSAMLRLKIDRCRSDILIFDFQNFTLPVISTVMSNMRKFLIVGQKGIPIRQKSVYVLNLPPAAESIMTIAKSFIRKDLLKKLHIIKDINELTSTIPTAILPKDYGGEEPPLEDLRDAWLNTLKYYSDWITEDEKDKADLSKRIISPNNSVGDLPSEGSFRKINLD